MIRSSGVARHSSTARFGASPHSTGSCSRQGLFDPIPAFLVGRAGYDNWLVWRGRQRGIVVDTTAVVVAIHQTHGYQHVEGGKDTAYYGPEAEHNIELAGGRSHIFTLHDASHRLGADFVLRRNPGAVLRVAETVRKVKWKLRTH